MEGFTKKPCKHCPFRVDVKPFLHPERAAEIAYATYNPYSTFHCHKTIVPDKDSDDGEMLVTENSLGCAGFLTLKAQDGGIYQKGLNPLGNCVTQVFMK